MKRFKSQKMQIFHIFETFMMIMSKSKRFFIFLFIAMLLADMYIYSYRITLSIQIFISMILFLSGAKTFSISFIRLVAPLVAIFSLSFLGTFYYGDYEILNIIKDISHMLKPLIGIVVGYMFARAFNDYNIFIKAVISAGIVSAIVHLCLLFIWGDFSRMTINDVRTETGRDSFLELFSLWFLIANPRVIRNQLFDSRIRYRLVVFILSASCLLYVSRAMLVAFILLVLAYLGVTKITQRSLKFIGGFLLMILLLYAYLFTIKPDRNAHGLEAFLYKIKIAPSEVFETNIDRFDHKDLWDHWRGYEVKQTLTLMDSRPGSYLFGAGMGSVVDLKFKAPLTNDDYGIRYISILHNGYVFILYKTGIIGLIILLGFLGSIYLFIYKIPQDDVHRAILVSISAIGTFYFFSSIIISGIYIPKDSVIFILGGLLFYNQLKTNGKKNTPEVN